MIPPSIFIYELKLLIRLVMINGVILKKEKEEIKCPYK